MEPIYFNPIGTIRTPHTSLENMPIQPAGAEGYTGYIKLAPNLQDGLLDLDGFSHITLVYHLHKVKGYNLRVTPFMDKDEHGIFATKSPIRPNPIGISTVKLLRIENNIIHIANVDMLDGTPLIDIKPFFENFDNRYDTQSGWLKKQKSHRTARSDSRFT